MISKTFLKQLREEILLIMMLLLTIATVNGQDVHSPIDSTKQKLVADQKIAINMCPGGIAFGIYSANVAYHFDNKQSIVIRGDYENIPQTLTDANIESNGKALILKYRYHLKDGGMSSPYLGAFSRYRVYKGRGSLESVDFDFSIPQVTVGVQAGRRWSWKSGFNLNFALGYGYSVDWGESSVDTEAIKNIIIEYREDYDFFSGFIGELSIGYAF